MDNVQLNDKKILVVEDDFSSRLYLNTLLEKAGAVVFNAGDGKEAYEIVMSNPYIELVLMDLQLPVVDGYTCARMLRTAGKKVTLIAQTAYGLAGDKERILASGFDDYLIKPISKSQLLDKLSSYLK